MKGYRMLVSDLLAAPELFSARLFDQMKQINSGIDEMDLYEFRYALNNVTPPSGWGAIELESPRDIEQRIGTKDFFAAVQLKNRQDGKIILDDGILRLTHMLLVGLVSGEYSVDWVNQHFYFDIRGFYFLVRINYMTDQIQAHLGNRPYRSFEQRQKVFERCQDIGYKAFREANHEIDQAFIESVLKLIKIKGTPIVLAIAGPTAAGKTEIVDRLRAAFEQEGQQVTSIEMDNFLTDREYREEKGIGTLGAEAIHFELFKQCLQDIIRGKQVFTPRYDFIYATSSHD
jgi:hypothetical protein